MLFVADVGMSFFLKQPISHPYTFTVNSVKLLFLSPTESVLFSENIEISMWHIGLYVKLVILFSEMQLALAQLSILHVKASRCAK